MQQQPSIEQAVRELFGEAAIFAGSRPPLSVEKQCEHTQVIADITMHPDSNGERVVPTYHCGITGGIALGGRLETAPYYATTKPCPIMFSETCPVLKNYLQG